MSGRGPSIALVLTVLAGSATAAAAQAPLPARVGAGVAFEMYTFGSPEAVQVESVRLLTTPIAARIGLAAPLTLELAGAFASATLTRADGSEATLSGLTDTEARLTLALGRDLVRVTAVALLPTGVEGLSDREADVAGLVASDVLPFRISNWGSGGGLGLSTAFAFPLGEFAAGMSAGYVVAREFEPTQDDFLYRPGSQLHVRAGIDRTIGSAGKAALQLTWLHFTEDQVDGANLYQSGDRLQAVGSYAFAAGARSSGIVYLGVLHRDGGEFHDVLRGTPAQDLIFTGGGLRMPAGGGVLVPAVDLRILRREDGVGQGYTASVGGSAEWPAGSVLIVPTLRGRFGNVTIREGAESAVTGFEVALAIRFGG